MQSSLRDEKLTEGLTSIWYIT